jgi:exo-beta-1,3-glucanase (GH17 family)
MINSFFPVIAFCLTIFPVVAVSGPNYAQTPQALLEGEVMAISYSGFRDGQHPDRGNGAVNPSDAEVLEDLRILESAGFGLIRLYDSGENSKTVLEVIRRHELPIKVLLGVWLEAELSNHEHCPWLTEPIPTDRLAANKLKNKAEIKRSIKLAKDFGDLVVAVNVGSEALVEWTDHLLTLEAVIGYVREVKTHIAQPVTVAENDAWWVNQGAALAAELDFVGVHTYPLWADQTIDEAMQFTVAAINKVHGALPGTKIAILEAGWATTAVEFGDRAGEANQKRYYEQIKAWAMLTHTTVFFFEAFDEPWKGDPNSPLSAEKHWGLFFVDRSPKEVMR